jgi:hypothetical protein|tara:strand:+ start:1024 stop:1224 length:201 start_codon:yes stop_codon:yes gene_type:complete
MDKNKKEIIKLILTLNLLLGIFNLYLFSQNYLLFNLVVGSANVGVWVFFRDLKLIPILMKYNRVKK